MKNIYLLSILSLLFSCHNKNAILLVENDSDTITDPVPPEIKPIETDTIIYTDEDFPQLEIDSQNIIFRQFETKSDSKKTHIDTIVFNGKYLELGKIVQHRKVVITIPFINTGEYPLVIRHCKSSGGLLTDCPKEPIFPNDTSSLDLIIYSRNIIGKSTKTATISTNAEQESFRIMVRWEYVAEE